MLGWKPCWIAVGVAALFGAPAAAQGVVPGGWAPQFSYQSFAGPGVAGFGVSAAYPAYGYGTTLPGLTPYYSSGSLDPYATTVGPPVVGSGAPAQTVNTIDPLAGLIRQSTRRKSTR